MPTAVITHTKAHIFCVRHGWLKAVLSNRKKRVLKCLPALPSLGGQERDGRFREYGPNAQRGSVAHRTGPHFLSTEDISPFLWSRSGKNNSGIPPDKLTEGRSA